MLTKLRLWDKMTADRVDHFIANSHTVQARIRKYYGRESVVMHPPVMLRRTNAQESERTARRFYLIGGRLVSYKRYDIAVQAFNKLGVPLKIFGTGPEEERLRLMAKPHVEFLGYVSDDALQGLYSSAEAFLHPQEEDFGLTAVEAKAAGCPVIAFAAGGALETVIEGKTGTFFEEQTWESLADAVLHFERSGFPSDILRQHALQFDEGQFQARLKDYVEDAWERFSRTIREPQKVMQSSIRMSYE